MENCDLQPNIKLPKFPAQILVGQFNGFFLKASFSFQQQSCCTDRGALVEKACTRGLLKRSINGCDRTLTEENVYIVAIPTNIPPMSDWTLPFCLLLEGYNITFFTQDKT